VNYPVLKDGVWLTPKYKKFKMICCDCSLVHDVDFRVKNGKIQIKITRNNISTALARR
jgi:hypothetical protein